MNNHSYQNAVVSRLTYMYVVMKEVEYMGTKYKYEES